MLPNMKARTEEFLYLLLWSCELLSRPTWRNLTESFEGWAYRKGLRRRLADLERRQFIERRSSHDGGPRVLRLTESGRVQALGGRDPEACWGRTWDGRWRLVLFDVPVSQGSSRTRLRRYLRIRGFGCLQKSVWVSPHPVGAEQAILRGSKADVQSLILLEARPCAGESDEEIVAGAWDFERINSLHARHLQLLATLPRVCSDSADAAKALRRWATQEREGWLSAVSEDPLLPESLLPAGYLGRKAWRKRIEVLGNAAVQIERLTS